MDRVVCRSFTREEHPSLPSTTSSAKRVRLNWHPLATHMHTCTLNSDMSGGLTFVTPTSTMQMKHPASV